MKQTICALIAALGIAGAGCGERTDYDCNNLSIEKDKVSFSRTVEPFGKKDTLTVVDKYGGVTEIVDYYDHDGEGRGEVNLITYIDESGESYTGYRNKDPLGLLRSFSGHQWEADSEYAQLKRKILAAKRN